MWTKWRQCLPAAECFFCLDVCILQLLWGEGVCYCAGVMGKLTGGGTDVCGNKELCRGHTEAFYTQWEQMDPALWVMELSERQKSSSDVVELLSAWATAASIPQVCSWVIDRAGSWLLFLPFAADQLLSGILRQEFWCCVVPVQPPCSQQLWIKTQHIPERCRCCQAGGSCWMNLVDPCSLLSFPLLLPAISQGQWSPGLGEARVAFGHFKVAICTDIFLTGRKDLSDCTAERYWSSPIQIWYPGREVYAEHLCIIDNF